MSEVNEGDQTNMWLPPRSGSGGPKPPGPRDPSEPKAEETSASARALAEGWPAHPGWVPEGANAWSTGERYAAPDQYSAPGDYTGPTHYQGEQYPGTQHPGTQQTGAQYPGTQYGGQPGWIPSQSPYPTMPDASGSGYGEAPSSPYPGPPPPLPGANTGKILGIVVAVVALVAAGVTAGVVLSGRGSDSPDSVATAPASSTGGTSSGGTTTGRNRDSTGTSSSGSGSSGASSTPQTGTSGNGTDQPPGTGPLDLTTVTLGGSVTGADAADMALTLDAYFTGINSGDYASAWNQLSPNQQAKNPFGQFTEATSGTIDHDVRLASATPNSDGTARASVTFTSTQPGSKGVNRGETCTEWSITYSLVRGSGAGGWVISDTPSAQHSAC